MKGREAILVLTIEFGSMLGQYSHQLSIPIDSRVHEWATPLLVSLVRRRARFEEPLNTV
jgi:hypothetical protein